MAPAAIKKGTARLAISSWEDAIDVKVLPVGINYSSFRRFGKNIFLNFGSVISGKDIDTGESDGKKYLAFNSCLQDGLQKLVFEIPAGDSAMQKKLLVKQSPAAAKIVLALPAIAGVLLNAPLYLPVKYFTKLRTADTDHYDSVLVALLIFLYPFYVLLVSIFIFFITGEYGISFLILLLFPFTAWAYVHLKEQRDK